VSQKPEAAGLPDADPRPEPPAAPDPLECCNSGCQPCVYDVYWEAVDRYEEALREWEERDAKRRAGVNGRVS
jgi:hypothetical protein